MRIPVQYLANLLTAGDTQPVLLALKRMLAMRHFKRAETVDGVTDTRALEEIYRQIDALEKSEAESRSVLIPNPLYRWPLGVALLAMVLLALNFLRAGRPGRSPGGRPA